MAMTGKHHKTKNLYLYKVGLIFLAGDPLHYGHIRLFKRAKEICYNVYAITESDGIILKEKGRKPFTTSRQRVEDLKGIKYIKEAFCRTKKKDRKYWVDKLKPDVLILGSDYRHKDWVGKKLGIKIVYFPRTEGISSTLLRK